MKDDMDTMMAQGKPLEAQHLYDPRYALEREWPPVVGWLRGIEHLSPPLHAGTDTEWSPPALRVELIRSTFAVAREGRAKVVRGVGQEVLVPINQHLRGIPGLERAVLDTDHDYLMGFRVLGLIEMGRSRQYRWEVVQMKRQSRTGLEGVWQDIHETIMAGFRRGMAGA